MYVFVEEKRCALFSLSSFVADLGAATMAGAPAAIPYCTVTLQMTGKHGKEVR